MLESYQIMQRQSLPLSAKIILSKSRIRQWFDHWDGDVYVSFSGGKDSVVLLHLVRSLYPNVKGVFLNTGLEFPEIKEFVKSFDNVEWVNPKRSFKWVIDKYGFPVINKEQSQYIYDYRHAKSEKNKHKRLYGADNKRKSGKISEKWKFMIDAPFQISGKCCTYLRKNPMIKYEKQTGLKSFIGLIAEESGVRMQDYRRYGCNSFDTNRPTSRPIAFWKESDVWNYIKEFDLKYCNIYDKGYNRTGCMFCLFGIHHQKNPNKLQLMKNTHPKLYEYCMNTLGLKKVIDYINEHGKEKIEYE